MGKMSNEDGLLYRAVVLERDESDPDDAEDIDVDCAMPLFHPTVLASTGTRNTRVCPGQS